MADPLNLIQVMLAKGHAWSPPFACPVTNAIAMLSPVPAAAGSLPDRSRFRRRSGSAAPRFHSVHAPSISS